MGVAGEDPQTEGVVCHMARALCAKRPGLAGGAIARGPVPVELAAHFCRACTAIAFQDDMRCLYCESRRPSTGWEMLECAKDPWLGRVVGERYLITRRIARGAAARVYEAESLNIHRQFAIKIVDFGSEAATPNPEVVRARLGREIAAMSQLRHPHIVRIVEVLELSKDCAALVMDYIRAPTLGRLLGERGALGWPRACRILRQIASAGHAAHQAGMVHRDLKPANIMVETIAGGDDFIHLLDFGIVWVDDGQAITNGFVGTPLYASPEQARGAAIDPRSDIYSLGVMFFEMLVGHPPFQHARVKEVLRMHVHKAAPGLQESAPNRIFPPSLPQLLDKMLQKQPQKRPQDMLALIDALDSIIAAPLNSRAERRLSQTGEAPSRLPGIPRPRKIIAAAALPPSANSDAPFVKQDAPSAETTRVGHGVLEVFSSPKAQTLAEIAQPVFVPKIEYNRFFS